MSNEGSCRFWREDGVVFERSGDRVVILTAGGDEMVTLNRLGSEVWLGLEHPSTLGDVVDHISSLHPSVPRSRVEGDVERFLEELGQASLVRTDAPG